MAAPNVSPRMRFPVAPSAMFPQEATTTTTATTTTAVAAGVNVPPPSNRSSQETISSPSSPQRINTNSTGSSPTKTSSSSSSYEFPTTFTQFHPSNKPTAPLYRPAALRSADHPAPPQPFPRRSSFSLQQQVPSVKRDHWKVVSPPFPTLLIFSSLMQQRMNALYPPVISSSTYSPEDITVGNAAKYSVILIPRLPSDYTPIPSNSQTTLPFL